MKPLAIATFPSPLGELTLLARDEALVGLYLPAQQATARFTDAVSTDVEAHPVLARAASELAGYFRGEVYRFTLPVALSGTPFQCDVWAALSTIPLGERRSYRWLAEHVGRPRAVRAVGAANARNALSVIVPCHRVVGADGALTGYAGGIDAKRWLLEHEQHWSTARSPGP